MTKLEKPQSILSKNLLAHALIDLLNDIPYKKINITALTKKADVSRRTFYRHFKTIDELLDFILQQIAKQFYEFQLKQSPRNLEELIFIYFTYWENRKNFLEVLKQNDLLYRLQNTFVSMIQSSPYIDEQTDNAIIDYAVAFSSGAVWGLLVKWLENGAIQSTQEMSDIAEQILNHIEESKINIHAKTDS